MALYDIYGNPLVVSSGENTNHLRGRTWFPIGDSITNNGSYRLPITAYYGLTEKSGGYGDGYQCGYGAGVNYSILNKIENFPSEKPDIVTIALGTNDYGNGCPIGEISDNPNSMTSESYTFYGCYKKLLTELHNRYGRTSTVLITPFPRVGMYVTNKSNHTLKDYADAIVAIGEYYSIPVCDMFGECGISVGTLSEMEPTGREYTADGLHLNGVSGGIVATKIANAMSYAGNELVIGCNKLTAYTGGNYASSPVTLSVGNTASVYAVREPIHTTYPITWKSSNGGVATATKDGTNYAHCSIKGIAKGTCTVTATCGSASLDFEVTVS